MLFIEMTWDSRFWKKAATVFENEPKVRNLAYAHLYPLSTAVLQSSKALDPLVIRPAVKVTLSRLDVAAVMLVW